LKVLTRYIGLEVLQRALLFMGVITVLLLAGRSLEFVEEMAQGEIPGEAVVNLLMLAIPKTLGLALPLSLFFGLLTTIARLCLDSEMDAMASAGVGLYSLLPIVLGLGALGMAAEAGITLWLEPLGERRMAQATNQFQQQALTAMVREGEFNDMPEGRVLFFHERGGDGRLKEVFFYDPDADPPMTLTAKEGLLTQGEGGEVEAVFFDGVRYQGRPREALVRVLEFERYRVRKSFGDVGGAKAKREGEPTPALWTAAWRDGKGAAANRIELFRRLSLPVSLPVLMLLAVPLGVENRRSGTRSYGVLWGALLLLLYHNVLIILEEWGLQGTTPPGTLLWGPPLVLAVLALVLLYRSVHGLTLVPRLPLGVPRIRQRREQGS